jgi:hypothetical protein
MIDLECPSCGRVGSVPNEKAHGRMVCKKCNMIFHMSPSGRAVLGEPPASRGADQGHGRGAKAVADTDGIDWSALLSDVGNARVKILGGLLAVGVLVLVYYFMAVGSGDQLQPKAQLAATALVEDSVGYLKKISSSDSTDDVDRLCQQLHPLLEGIKKESTGNKLLVTVLVTEESRATGRGKVEAFFAAVKGPSRTEAIAAEAGAVGKSKSSHELSLFWVWEGGTWRFDAKQTLINSIKAEN